MLTIHRSERADLLVHALAEVLATPPEDPFTPEVVAVPSKGVERWISQGLAARLGTSAAGADGVCANVQFPSPARLVSDVVARATGVDPDDDPWAARRLPWALLEVIDECATEPWCATLGRHIGAVGDGDVHHRRGRRVAVAQKIGDLFTSYAAQRPDLVRAWLDGDDGDLDGDLLWQSELLRRLRSHLGVPGPAERLDAACIALRKDPSLAELPERLSLFGPTRLTVEQVRVVDALASHRDVRLWLTLPSPALWERVDREAVVVGDRRSDPSAALARHPLLSSLGRDARELQLMLREHAGDAAQQHHPWVVEPTSLLWRLQRDLTEDRAPAGDLDLSSGDRSVQVHSCHGRLRQVEVMREVLLGLLEDDPTLELRDVLVMCPDIEAYAPLVSATFGLAADDEAEAHPAHGLRVRLADRSLRETNPVLSVLARLLDFADARITASDVLDFAALTPVRRRFAFDDEALERVGDWVRRSGVRWGLDATARAPYSLQDVPHNTWQSGLDRLLVGVTMDEEELRTFGDVLPFDDIDSGEIDLAGRLAELVERLASAVGSLSERRSLVDWVEALETALDELTDVSPREGWQVTQARAQLQSAVGAAGDRATTVPIALADVRSLLSELLKGKPTRANFRTGHLTMCSMVPMRSVPHRVVVLLGLDDQAFPRHVYLDGDNVLARRPRVGERDARSEDRQLFLDAILAAKEHLVLLYSGHDERTGAVRPPAVPLGELLDVLDGTASVATGLVRERVLVQHPLQPFDPRNFVAEGPFSFDRAAVQGARAMSGPRVERPVFLGAPLPPAPVDDVELGRLVEFIEHPVKAFLRRRLNLALDSDRDDADDELTVELGGLAGWQVGDRLLRVGLAGGDLDAAVKAELVRGVLPPGPLGERLLAPLRQGVDALVAKSAGLRSGDPSAVDVDVALPSGRRVLGTVANVYGDCAVRIEWSKLKPKHRLVGWLNALVLTAHDSDVAWRSMVAGRDGDGDIAWSFVSGLSAEQARAELDTLVELYDLGMCEPLPISEAASSTYAERRAKGAPPKDALTKAEAAWRSAFEHTDVALRCAWGEAGFAAMTKALAVESEAGVEPDGEPTRFGVLARRLWQPVIDGTTRS